MNNCPHCGSTNSFEYTATLITKRIGFWGKNDDEESEVENSKFPKTVRCGDCGKRVNFELAHGQVVEHGVQSDLLPCGHSVNSLGGFGGCNPNGSCMECVAREDDQAVEQSVQRTVCTSCETELNESNVYCHKCGLWNPANRR